MEVEKDGKIDIKTERDTVEINQYEVEPETNGEIEIKIERDTVYHDVSFVVEVEVGETHDTAHENSTAGSILNDDHKIKVEKVGHPYEINLCSLSHKSQDLPGIPSLESSDDNISVSSTGIEHKFVEQTSDIIKKDTEVNKCQVEVEKAGEVERDTVYHDLSFMAEVEIDETHDTTNGNSPEKSTVNEDHRMKVDIVEIPWEDNSSSQNPKKKRKTPVRKSNIGISNVLKCEICDKIYKTQASYNKHMKRHTDPKFKSYSCEFCQKSFIQKVNLERHKKYVHSKTNCYYCNRYFDEEAELTMHERVHTIFNNKSPFVCDVCKKTFTTKSNLTTHKKIHTGRDRKSYVCDVCSKVFSSKGNLKVHTKIHTGERDYVCDICKKTFITKADLLKHQRYHSGLKPYQCDICTKSYHDRSNLVIHKKTHTGEKNHACAICPKRFITKRELVLHMRHHTGERPYPCELCSKSFTQSANLSAHMRLHTGECKFHCEICLKAFVRKDYLQSHMKRRHTGENGK